MTNFTRYPSYKDSGVEWIGEIPEHWEIKKLKFVSNNKTTKSFESDFKIALENIESQTAKYIETQEVVFSEAGINFKKGDVLFGKLRPYLAKVYLAEKDGICVSEFLVLESKNIKNLFLKYILISSSWIQHINSSTYGTKMPRASWDFIGNSLVPLPPKDEQTKIASFLDKKTTQINQAIAQKERLVELLKEKKQITINDAVTKGLDKNATLKDSGVEWIGEIPEHWQIRKGKYLFKQMKRPVREQDEIVTCFRDGVVTLRSNRRTEGFTNALKEHGYQGVRKGDLIIHNMDAFAGSIGISDSDGKSTPVYTVCKPWDENLVSSEYYAGYLRNLALQDFILSLAKGIRERSTDFRFKDFGELVYPLPPKDEQIQIVEYLQNQTTKIDKAIQLQQNYIAKLKEYKASLIDSVVRGKVRVR